MTTPTPQTAAQKKADHNNLRSAQGKAYDPDITYSDSTNDRCYENPRVKIPPDTNNILNYVAGEFDHFRSKQDFIRDAIHHRLHHFVDADPNTPLRIQDLMEQEDWNEELLLQQREALAEKEYFELVRERMNAMIDDLDWKGLQNLWERADDMSEREDIPEGRRLRFCEQTDELMSAMTDMKKQRSKYQAMTDNNVTASRKKAQQ